MSNMEPIEPIEPIEGKPPQVLAWPDLTIGDRIQVLRPDLDDCDCALPQETIDLFRGIVGHCFTVRGFDRYDHIEIWTMVAPVRVPAITVCG
jgi:hypothetical protein